MRKVNWAKRAKYSAFGRTLCRLFGNEAGGVMMEYVILAVLIAAAVVVAVMFFGKNIKSGFNAMSQTVAGESTRAGEVVQQMKTDADTAETVTTGRRPEHPAERGIRPNRHALDDFGASVERRRQRIAPRLDDLTPVRTAVEN